jgi:glycosyltransferase involved in cell wall biosynthesis
MRSAIVTVKRGARDALGALLVRYAAGGPPRPGARPAVHILLSSAWGMGGTIRTVLNLAGHLAGEREVHVITTYRRRDRPYFAFAPGVRVNPLDDQRPGAVHLWRRPLRRLLGRQGSVLMHPHDLLYQDHSLWTDVRLARALRGRVGVVIGTRPGLNLLAARVAGPRLVAVGTEHMHLSSHTEPLRDAMRRHYPRLAALVVLTERDREEYLSLLDGRPPVSQIPNAVGDIAPPFADMTARTVLAAGRLNPQKGLDLLIDAFARVAPEHPGWVLRIVGHGRERESLQTRIDSLGLTDRVTLAGPTEDMAGEMARASVYALSSRWEGFPLVLIEAMSKGMAVAAYDCPTGPAELVDDHRNGLLVAPEDVAGLAAALGELMADEELRRRCAAAALRTAERYTLREIGARWDALLGGLGV